MFRKSELPLVVDEKQNENMETPKAKDVSELAAFPTPVISTTKEKQVRVVKQQKKRKIEADAETKLSNAEIQNQLKNTSDIITDQSAKKAKILDGKTLLNSPLLDYSEELKELFVFDGKKATEEKIQEKYTEIKEVKPVEQEKTVEQEDFAPVPNNNFDDFLPLDDFSFNVEAPEPVPNVETAPVQVEITPTQTISEVQNTAEMKKLLREKLSSKDRVLFNEVILNGTTTKRNLAASFFEVLVLSTKGFLKVEQSDAFGEITILPRKKLFEEQ